MKKLTIVKIGGNVVDEPLKLDEFLLKLHKIQGPKILIHGGGKDRKSVGRERVC